MGEQTMDITEIILTDHEQQRRLFARLDDVDRADTATLGSLWIRIADFLEVHAQAEEQFFYPQLLKLGERLRERDEAAQTKDAIGDHNDIRDAVARAGRSQTGTAPWWEGVDAARKANDEHMGEEEHEGLRDFRQHVDLQTRHDIAIAFITFQAQHPNGIPLVDKDPEHYVERNS